MCEVIKVRLKLLHLTLYRTITTFNATVQDAFWKHCGKRRKCWLPAFSPFPTMFSTVPKTNFNFSVRIILSSAYAFNLDQSKILSFGKKLGSQCLLVLNCFENEPCPLNILLIYTKQK